VCHNSRRLKATAKTALFRSLPAIDELLRLRQVAALVASDGHPAVAESARAVLARMRDEISAGRLDERTLSLAVEGLPAAIERELRRSMAYSLRPVINATGVILHTNLGRAPLAQSALEHIRETAGTYSNLEFDISAGERGKRDVHVERLFARLFSFPPLAQQASPRRGRPDPGELRTVVVNNNAAAVLITLNTLAEGGEVIVSRGELVEIGGSFRVPEVMAKSGAVLREVGTTNRTRIADYERAITERTRLLLRVHRSNFQIVGFTEQPPLDELVALGQKHKIVVVEDLGSGALFDVRSAGIENEPGVTDSLRAGVDVVTYSGDKLLGGPQAGLITGRAELVARIRSNPLFRALRVDKLAYAALEATLLAYAKRDYNAIPALRMMSASAQEIHTRTKAWVAQLTPDKNLRCEIIEGESLAGGGAAPAATLPTSLIAITSNAHSADEFAARLRAAEPPVVARVDEGRVLLDLRTVFPEQEPQLAAAVVHAAHP
jgi:L-seryl-tRNA(Ser) seleniumtransferase